MLSGKSWGDFRRSGESIAAAKLGNGAELLHSMPTEKLKLVRPAAPAPPRAASPPARPARAPSRPARAPSRPAKRRGALYWLGTIAALGFLLALPGRALVRSSEFLTPLQIAGYVAIVSLVAAWQLRADKRAARNDEWRVSESRLHFLELMGGWAASFVTQRVLRHKTAKASYQNTFWFVVALHQYAAIDFVQSWKWTLAAYAALEPILR